MTNEPVIIKGTKEGVTIVVEENSNFEDVKKIIYEKLQNSRNFFTGAKVSLKAKNGFLKKEDYTKLQEILSDFGMSLQEAKSPKTLIFPKPNRSRVLLLKRTVRSGQKISYKGTVVILGDANPGSEIVATGDILVMGTLRGMAHAGAAGDTSAIVAAFRLQPTQLRIADVISRPPEDKEQSPLFPEIARLKDNMIVIEPYNSLK
ncbi:MAG TPA: septum site-determining protein MinC [Thermoanaerobacterales bacterium]|uniref:septum site-determining protein MinC n=1 Tax=Tepidanaerobacter sp. GT38 TaxID=2722793 RepID=UPI0017EB5544|nr:septum site-determining protein MinC [Tepidanaerobacter sp. GT38]MCG1012768.1 septum site-determining protein MinC [Tepidanaerobacter sp. GT38]HHY41878.1 septum site-determining protein MinC [Thermoanaerobacterales bacterium]